MTEGFEPSVGCPTLAFEASSFGRSDTSPLVSLAFTFHLTRIQRPNTVVGSYLGSAVPSRDIPTYAEMWRSGKLPVEKLISHRIRLGQINEAMDELAQGRAVRQVILMDEE